MDSLDLPHWEIILLLNFKPNELITLIIHQSNYSSLMALTQLPEGAQLSKGFIEVISPW